MADQVGRARGSSQVDPDLDRASGLLRYPGDRWYFDFSAGLAPQAPAESQYREAARRLLAYNERLVSGDAVFDRRADNLLRTLDRIAADLGSSSAVIADHIAADEAFLLNFPLRRHLLRDQGPALRLRHGAGGAGPRLRRRDRGDRAAGGLGPDDRKPEDGGRAPSPWW